MANRTRDFERRIDRANAAGEGADKARITADRVRTERDSARTAAGRNAHTRGA
ncbi:hypothetical protein ACFQ7F_41870 [Streptomyces sp. NPDC056486]|uniref:hypothetical protein n=1 Tax=Streptomyces sp. NPDC056486 TaxID=3345835 RepID=UPI0036790F5E